MKQYIGTLKLLNETQTSDTFELKLNDYLRPTVPYMIVHVNDHVLCMYCTVGCSDLVIFFDFIIWPPFMNEIYVF